MLAQLAPSSHPLAGGGFLWFTAIWLVATAFWLWMLVDCLTKKRLAGNEKIVWVLVLLLTQVIGALLYLLLVRGRRPAGG